MRPAPITPGGGWGSRWWWRPLEHGQGKQDALFGRLGCVWRGTWVRTDFERAGVAGLRGDGALDEGVGGAAGDAGSHGACGGRRGLCRNVCVGLLGSGLAWTASIFRTTKAEARHEAKGQSALPRTGEGTRAARARAPGTPTARGWTGLDTGGVAWRPGRPWEPSNPSGQFQRVPAAGCPPWPPPQLLIPVSWSGDTPRYGSVPVQPGNKGWWPAARLRPASIDRPADAWTDFGGRLDRRPPGFHP